MISSRYVAVGVTSVDVGSSYLVAGLDSRLIEFTILLRDPKFK